MSSTCSSADRKVQTTLDSGTDPPIDDLRASCSNHSTSRKVFCKGEANYLQPLLIIMMPINAELQVQHPEIVVS